MNYSANKKELLAFVFGVTYFRPYLYGQQFKMITDHHSLCYLFSNTKRTGMLARWALILSEYTFDIIYKSGKKHLDADTLSRGSVCSACNPEHEVLSSIQARKQHVCSASNSSALSDIHQSKQGICSACDLNDTSPDISPSARVVCSACDKFDKSSDTLLQAVRPARDLYVSPDTRNCAQQVCSACNSVLPDIHNSTPVTEKQRLINHSNTDYCPPQNPSPDLSHLSTLTKNNIKEEEARDDDFNHPKFGSNIKALLEQDEWARKIISHLQTSSANPPANIDTFKIENNILWHKGTTATGVVWSYVVPFHLREEVIKLGHGTIQSGHFGIARTYERLRNYFYFPKMIKVIHKYIRSCQDCLSAKAPRVKEPGHLFPIPFANYPFERVGMDLVGPIQASSKQNNYILSTIDHLTRYVEVFPISGKTSSTVLNEIKKYINSKGPMRTLLTDNGGEFVSHQVEVYLQSKGIEHMTTAPHSPRGNGMIERFHQTLKALVIPHVQHRHADWEEYLQELVYAYNTSKHSTTGFPPYFLLYGSLPRPTGDLDKILFPEQEEKISVDEARELAKARTLESQHHSACRFNQGRQHPSYNIGDVVGIRNYDRSKFDESSKFLPTFKGPYRVIKKLSGRRFQVKDMEASLVRTVHIKDMKSWRLRSPLPEEDQSSHEDFASEPPIALNKDYYNNLRPEDCDPSSVEDPSAIEEEINRGLRRSKRKRRQTNLNWPLPKQLL